MMLDFISATGGWAMHDLDYLGKLPIAVIGGGASGRTQAADCALAGREVRMYESPEFAPALGNIRQSRCIRISGDEVNLYGFRRNGQAMLDMVTTDMEEAVSGAGLVVISVPAVAFKPIFQRLIPCLDDGQVLHFMTGNFGSLMLRKMMREAGCDKNVIIGEWSSQPYGTRIKHMGKVPLPEVHIYYRAITLRGAALPASDQAALMASITHLPSMDGVVYPIEGDTVVDIGFSNVNPILHVPGTLLGVGTMENMGTIFGNDKHDFCIYSHAYCPSLSKVQLALYKEECRIAEAMGVGIQPFRDADFFSRSNILGQEYMGPDFAIPFEDQYDLIKGTGPTDIMNRYVTEDIPFGCHIYHQLGKKFHVETPVIESMIVIGSIMTGIDFFETGTTLGDLGIAHLEKEPLLDYLRNGKYTQPEVSNG